MLFSFTGMNPLLLTTTTTLPTSPAASPLFCKCLRRRRRRRRLTAHLAALRRRNWRSRVRHISPRHRRKSALRRQVRGTIDKRSLKKLWMDLFSKLTIDYQLAQVLYSTVLHSGFIIGHPSTPSRPHSFHPIPLPFPSLPTAAN